jgi:adenine deaminase
MKNPTLAQLQQCAAATTKRLPGSLLLKNCRIVDVLGNAIERQSILIQGPLIAGVGHEWTDKDADVVIDMNDALVVPGLIDGHLHIESSLVTPSAYEAAVLPRGVTSIIADPHEVANVDGVSAIEWMIEESRTLKMDVWIAVPSSVPASNLESNGATITNDDVRQLLNHPRVVAIGEVMNVPGFVGGDAVELEKAGLVKDLLATCEGHAPGLCGPAMQAYFAMGVHSDHESTTLDEALAKLKAGCFVMVREGSATRNLEALIQLVDIRYCDRIGLVTDDRLPHDLLSEGGVDFVVRKAISLGADPIYAIRCATWNTARHFGLRRFGAIAPGFFADLFVCDDLTTLSARRVMKRGEWIDDGYYQQKLDSARTSSSTTISNSIFMPTWKAEDFIVGWTNEHQKASTKLRVIEAIPSQILTREVHVAPTISTLPNGELEVTADILKDLAKLVCAGRHRPAVENKQEKRKLAIGFATGFGLQRGAIACSVAHDHHNCLALGIDDRSLATALNRLRELQGGLVVVLEDSILAELALPYYGLISTLALSDVRRELDAIDAAAKSLGCTLPSQIMALSFMGLEVIPDLKLTDLGLVDVTQHRLVSLEVEAI